MIVVSLPGENDEKYYAELDYIAKYFSELDSATFGRDHLFIIHDKSGRSYLDQYSFKHANFIEVKDFLDPWLRDFPPTMPKIQVKLKYKPQYLSAAHAIRDEETFANFSKLVDLPDLTHLDIVLEGGNIVENGKDIAVVSGRIFEDNKDMTEADIKAKLEAAIKRSVVFIEDPMDTTGHADGIVTFVEEDVLLVAYYVEHNQSYYQRIQYEVEKAFPDVLVVPLPSYQVGKTSWNISSSVGSYANSLVTYNTVYLPFFSNETYNQKALEVFKNNTDKDVIPIRSAGNLGVLGGSIRCLSWQIDAEHPIAMKLFEYVATTTATPTTRGSAGRVGTVAFLYLGVLSLLYVVLA